uniref:Basic leucine zipper and W2 domain-containing protein 1-like n=1 Tax=Hirondellea gigas TaxID=1518452 RepID=A0A2P2HW28_9CRUS
MSTKAEKPVLQGQRIKTRKRDERAKFDPIGFRDSILQGFAGIGGTDLEAIHRYLDAAGSKLDYRTYGEALFDILLAGGILAPGGVVSDDGAENGPVRTTVCVFGAPEANIETLRPYAQLFVRLMRRYKYLEKMFFEEIKKSILFLRGFSEGDRDRLSICIAMWAVDGIVDPRVLTFLIQEHLVKEGIAVDFLCKVLLTSRALKDVNQMRSLLRKSGLDNRMMEFLPANKRTPEYFSNLFHEKDLSEIVNLQRSLEKEGGIKKLVQYLSEHLNDSTPNKEISLGVQELAKKHCINESTVIGTIWSSVMSDVEWNKKEELVADQALKHLRVYTPLFQAHTPTARSELHLLIKVQEFSYDNMNFMKVFQKIVMLFYKNEILSEEVILKWYKDSHSGKGKSIFLDQMKKFVEWLQSAEEESDDESEEEEEEA